MVGVQWGDEGKGKIVDSLTSNAEYVVRFQGGNNAGHTLVVDGRKTKLRLVPSGILRPDTICCIAAGVVLDADVFKEELEELKQSGVSVEPNRLLVDQNTHLIMPYQRAIDIAREARAGSGKIGTTGRGIGPCYEDRANRTGVRVCELYNIQSLMERLKPIIFERNIYLKEVLKSEVEILERDVLRYLNDAASLLIPHIANISLKVSAAYAAEKRIVFEGAQGTLLDQIHGTIPYVTSSNTIAGAVLTGCGVGPRTIDHILGVVKAYCTRVGEGPFPTEESGKIGDYLREVGHEFGTVTGRARRCGWFDAVLVKEAVRLNGVDSLALTKLDVLSGLDAIKVCIGYELDGVKCVQVPPLASELAKIKPIYVEFAGWKEDITGIRKWYNLPQNAKVYLSSLAEMVGCDISMVSVGPGREATIYAHGSMHLKNFIKNEL